MKKVFVIDNYDSFTYNLVHYLEEMGCEVTVKRNDQFELEELEAYPMILLSPGPGIPDESGLLKAAIEHYAPTKKILGVCLGQQAIDHEKSLKSVATLLGRLHPLLDFKHYHFVLCDMLKTCLH